MQEKEVLTKKEENVNTSIYALEINDVYKSYGKKEVLKGISFKVKKGEIYGYIGKNGVGKSTLIDSIVGLKDFNDGDILIAEKSIKNEPKEAKKLFKFLN